MTLKAFKSLYLILLQTRLKWFLHSNIQFKKSDSFEFILGLKLARYPIGNNGLCIQMEITVKSCLTGELTEGFDTMLHHNDWYQNSIWVFPVKLTTAFCIISILGYLIVDEMFMVVHPKNSKRLNFNRSRHNLSEFWYVIKKS